MEKSPEAFRTISEAAETVGVPTHVLRFWESRFPQVKPVKRAGGRRYYRPDDVEMLVQIKKLLHEDGMTIRGARKVLRGGSPDAEPPARPKAQTRLTLSEAPMAVDVEPEPEAPASARVLSFSRRPPELMPEPEPELEAEVAEDAVIAEVPPGEAPEPTAEPPANLRLRLKADADHAAIGELVARLEALSARLGNRS